jgi:uncharacterized protein YecE (DUF72 family)
MIKVGLCGFTMAVRDYFETFGVVEVQQTFYEPPAPRTILRWREQAPEGFEFTMKAWQLITHRSSSTTYRRLRTPLERPEEAGAFQLTPTVMRGWETTLDAARILRATAILFQCPASFRPVPENVENMRRFFTTIERPPGVRLLWEPRGAWPDDLLATICDELSLVHVVDPFLRSSIHTDLVYWRLHGIGNHYHVYTDAELRDLARRIDPASRETYVMFNNIPRVGDAQRFIRCLMKA